MRIIHICTIHNPTKRKFRQTNDWCLDDIYHRSINTQLYIHTSCTLFTLIRAALFYITSRSWTHLDDLAPKQSYTKIQYNRLNRSPQTISTHIPFAKLWSQQSLYRNKEISNNCPNILAGKNFTRQENLLNSKKLQINTINCDFIYLIYSFQLYMMVDVWNG